MNHTKEKNTEPDCCNLRTINAPVFISIDKECMYECSKDCMYLDDYDGDECISFCHLHQKPIVWGERTLECLIFSGDINEVIERYKRIFS